MGKKKINIVEGIKSKKGLIGEFKEFISRGNVIDLAVGVVMGSAFTAIVTSLVNDMITPLIGLIMGGIDFSDLKVTIPSAIEARRKFLSRSATSRRATKSSSARATSSRWTAKSSPARRWSIRRP